MTTTLVQVKVQLVDDDVFERTEKLFANLSFAADPGRNVTISPAMAEIMILDDDG